MGSEMCIRDRHGPEPCRSETLDSGVPSCAAQQPDSLVSTVPTAQHVQQAPRAVQRQRAGAPEKPDARTAQTPRTDATIRSLALIICVLPRPLSVILGIKAAQSIATSPHPTANSFADLYIATASAHRISTAGKNTQELT